MNKKLPILLLILLALGDSLSAQEANSPAIVIRDVAVFDAEAGTMLPHRNVIIEGEWIKEVGPSEGPIPESSQVIDGSAKYLIPGLIDAHVHLVHLADRTHVTGDELLPYFLAAGVTSVRSTGDAIVAAATVAHFAQDRPESCPRVFLASPLIDGPAPVHRDVGYSLTDVSQVPAFVDDMAKWNVTTLKLYVGTTRDVGRAMIEHGHQRGMVVTAHLGAYSAQDACEDGIDCLEHIWSVFNYAIPDDVLSQADHRSYLDLQNPKCQALVLSIAQHKVAVDPTLVVFRNMIYLNDLPEVQSHPDMQFVPDSMLAYWESYREASALSQETLAARQLEVRKYQELTGILHRAGVMILAGTDAPEPFVTPGFSLHQELEMLVEAGLTPADALRAATFNNAQILHQPALGTIARGKLADLVLPADPTLDIRNSRKIELVVRSGRIVVPRDLLSSRP